MSPLQIEILMHYYTTPGDYREGDFSAPAVREAIDDFVRCEMLQHTNVGYTTTARSRAFIEYICKIPLPECHWVINPVS